MILRDETLEIICRNLSMQCRFGGSVRRFYSVAEHTVHMVRQARDEGEASVVQLLLWLHDAPEATTGDLLPVVKLDPPIARAYVPIEVRAMKNFCMSLGLPVTRGVQALDNPAVKNYDKDILAAELKFVKAASFTPDGPQPYDPNNTRHVMFKHRLQAAAPYGDNFNYWKSAMIDEFYQIIEDM